MLMTAISYDSESGSVARGVLVTHMQYQSAVSLQEGKRLLTALPVLLPEPLISRWKASNKRIMLPAISLQQRKSKGEFWVGVESAPDLASQAFLVVRTSSPRTDMGQVFQDEHGQPLRLLMSGHNSGYIQMAMVLPAGKIITIKGDSGIRYAFFNGRVLIHTTAIGRTLDYGFNEEAASVRKEMPRMFPRNARAT
jgi:hypothetical protein